MLMILDLHVMKKFILILLAFVVALPAYPQDIRVTFSAAGAATTVDSVKATNMKTNKSITLPGNENLILTPGTGIPTVTKMVDSGIIYPNPFSGNTTISLKIPTGQSIIMVVHDLAGQLVNQLQFTAQPGWHDFILSTGKAGIYIVSIKNVQAITSYKILCSTASPCGNRIIYRGLSQNPSTASTGYDLKFDLSGYSLAYSNGDVIHFQGWSGSFSTIITDAQPISGNYVFEFASCTDPDGKNYSMVNIGRQTWMAENLAYLPQVSPSDTGSDTQKHYYVNEYEGTNIVAAKATPNYSAYGVLYNWPAAMIGASSSNSVPSGVQGICPSGWHLPSEAEWKILENYLGMTVADLNKTGWRYSGTVGRKLKSTSGWYRDGNGNNYSGFNAVPGGGRYFDGGFLGLDRSAYFWSSTENGSPYAYSRSLGFSADAVYRTINDYHRVGLSVRCVKD
jgi:uncharacterized protein (TIGR02145 family)